MNHQEISGIIVDVTEEEMFSGTLIVEKGTIVDRKRMDGYSDRFIIPGFIDSHVHIESSMLPPSEFARAAVIHGTVATVSDPHEIANVLGMEGLRYMIENGETVPMKFYFSAPSCVPASPFETSGAVLDGADVKTLLEMPEIRYLGEVMNYPGVINRDPEVTRKIHAALQRGKPADGHAPGLCGRELAAYAAAGISTNHECLSPDEVREDIRNGITVQIREGSAAGIFSECLPILEECFTDCMFCSDDKHPDDLLKGHINDMVKRACRYGIDPLKVLRMAAVNPVHHYGLDVGLLRPGDSADFLVVDNLSDFTVLETHIEGKVVARNGMALFPHRTPPIVNRFNAQETTPADFTLPCRGDRLNVIGITDGQIITSRLIEEPTVHEECVVSDIGRDILKIAVINRYDAAPPSVGFVKHFGLKRGAVASTVSHDSHNIVAVGVTDDDIARAVNLLVDAGGGIAAVSGEAEALLPLPVAGLMSDRDYRTVAESYTGLDRMAKSMGSMLRAPFMTLSFMALSVVPSLKLTDRGLFNGETFAYIDLFQS